MAIVPARVSILGCEEAADVQARLEAKTPQ